MNSVQIHQLDTVSIDSVGDGVRVRRPIATHQLGTRIDQRGTNRSLNLIERTVGLSSGEDRESCHAANPDGRPQEVNSRHETRPEVPR